MIDHEILVLAGTAASIGFLHTLLGPDHYLPFIVMSRARQWTLPKTLWISFLCGLGHVLSSVLLGFAGIALGIAVNKLEGVESARGGIAAWLLIGFGFAYFIWGVRRAWKNKPHIHSHVHDREGEHDHPHVHEAEHYHLHHRKKEKANLTPWILFTIFIFGPCEPLIPLFIYPAAKHNLGGAIIVASAFSLFTILTMLTIIAVSSWGVRLIHLGKLERYAHALAGAMIFISGLSVQFLGL